MGYEKKAAGETISGCFPYIIIYIKSLFPVSEKAEQVKEQVDKIEIEGEGPQQRHFLSLFGLLLAGQQLFDFLGVVCRQPYENEYAGIGGNPVEGVVGPEEVNDRGQNQADEQHEKQVAERGQVFVGEIAVQTHQPEGAGRREEGHGNGAFGKNKEDDRQGESVDERIEHEQSGGGGKRNFIYAGRNEKYEGQFGNNQTEKGGPAAEYRILYRTVADG